MLSTAEAFDKFRKKLELSDTESKDASKRQTQVRDCIRGGFDVNVVEGDPSITTVEGLLMFCTT